jgi:hypothetical protein
VDAPLTDVPTIDAPALTAQLRMGDEQAVQHAYRAVFASELGKFVLLHHLWACGVGRRLGNDANDAQLRYSAGMMDSAILLANEAGYDEAALAAAAVLTQELPDERHAPSGFGTVLDDGDLDGVDA